MDWAAPLCLGVLSRKCQSWLKCCLPNQRLLGCPVVVFLGWFKLMSLACCSFPSSKSRLPKMGLGSKGAAEPLASKTGIISRKTSHFCFAVILERKVNRYFIFWLVKFSDQIALAVLYLQAGEEIVRWLLPLSSEVWGAGAANASLYWEQRNDLAKPCECSTPCFHSKVFPQLSRWNVHSRSPWCVAHWDPGRDRWLPPLLKEISTFQEGAEAVLWGL